VNVAPVISVSVSFVCLHAFPPPITISSLVPFAFTYSEKPSILLAPGIAPPYTAVPHLGDGSPSSTNIKFRSSAASAGLILVALCITFNPSLNLST